MNESVASVGLVDPASGRVVLCDRNVTAAPARRFRFGPFDDASTAVAGDWNGDRLAGIALYSASRSLFRLRDASDGFIGHRIVVFGPRGGKPVAGDWTGRGADGLGVYDPQRGLFFLKDDASSGDFDHCIAFGEVGDDVWPIAGRFSPDAPPGDSIGLYNRRLGTFHLKTVLESGPADLQFEFGPAGKAWLPLAGDWTGCGYDTVGLVDPESRGVYLRFENRHGDADAQFAILDDALFGASWQPVAGRFAGVHGVARPRSPLLDADGHLRSRIWIDRPDASDRVAERCKARGLPADFEQPLRELIECGYTILRHPGVVELAARIEADIAKIWQEKPADLLLVAKGREKGIPFSQIDPALRHSPWRIPDLHSHSAAARELYLSELLFDFVELAFDEPAVAIQSLYFSTGSEQGLHRDPMFVVTDPPSHLLAAWVALEDIGGDAGPLVYLPGSHRLPYVESRRGGVGVSIDGDSEVHFERVIRELASQASEYGLEKKELVCRRGDVLIWHGSLFHGGAPVRDPGSTRKSFVIHYSTRARYPERVSNYEAREGRMFRKRWVHKIARTRRLIGDGRANGVDNPLRG